MRSLSSLSLVIALVAGAFYFGAGCSDDGNATTEGSGTTNPTSSGPGGGNTGGSGAGSNVGGAGGDTTSSTGTAPTTIAECQGHVYACGDLVDNDDDGLIDSQDPDCLGACDNTEDSYYGGITGQDGNACTLDCYFDQDGGNGNDNCYWNHKCDPNEVAPNYYPEPEYGAQCEYDTNANTPGTSASCDEMYTDQLQGCYDYCGPLTPNGCDCFGCCELPAGSGSYVWLGSEDNADNGSCTAAGVDDPDLCHPCLPVAACLNDCGPCEICIGKPTPDPGCDGSGGGGGGGGGSIGQCPDGIQPCGLPGQSPCPADSYCVTGCCQFVPE